MSKKRIIVTVDLLLGLAIIIVAARFVISLFNMPANGSISTSSTQTAYKGMDLTPKSLVGKYATFSYPAALTKDTSSKFAGSIVAIYDFSYSDVESWNLAIDILTVPSGQLSGNNAYQFRKISPTTYQESTLTINHTAVDVMTDKTVGGFSKIAFLISGQYQATISLYGDDQNGTDNLQATFNMILSSWHWHVS